MAAALIDALGGGGSLPCWIKEARCATAGGKVGPTAGAAGPAAAAEVPRAGAGGAGLLITVLLTVVLWMLTKMMLFGGGTT